MAPVSDLEATNENGFMRSSKLLEELVREIGIWSVISRQPIDSKVIHEAVGRLNLICLEFEDFPEVLIMARRVHEPHLITWTNFRRDFGASVVLECEYESLCEAVWRAIEELRLVLAVETGLANPPDKGQKDRYFGGPLDSGGVVGAFRSGRLASAKIWSAFREVDSCVIMSRVQQEIGAARRILDRDHQQASQYALLNNILGLNSRPIEVDKDEQLEQPKVPTRAERLAFSSFGYAEHRLERDLLDREAYDWLKENGIQEADNELADYKLPTFDTWSRQLREARRLWEKSKNVRRAGLPTGRSIVRRDQIELRRTND